MAQEVSTRSDGGASDEKYQKDLEDATQNGESESQLKWGSEELNLKERVDYLAEKYEVDQRWLMIKRDIICVLPISLLYLLAFLDRVNISNAQGYGLAEDLGLKGNQYNTALTVFFVPYVLFEVPSNFLLKKLKPHVWLSFCLFCFGAVTIGVGFVPNFGGLVGLRFVLGLFEAPMFSGSFYILTNWYTRREAQKRYSFFFSSTSLAGAFGGLIAYGVHTLDMKFGIEGWRWVFIVEGSITAFIALFLFFSLADFPEDAKFLSENERQFLKEKLALDSGDSYANEKIGLKDMLRVFKDVKIWLATFMYFGFIVAAYGYAYFSVQIIKTFQYSAVKTQVYSIFPWLTSFGASIIVAFFSDLSRHRFLFIIGLSFIAIAGYGILLGTEAGTLGTVHTRYAACFLIVIGLYSAMPILICWTQMNAAGHLRRMVFSGWQVGFGNSGGIVSTFIFLTRDAPEYTRGLSVSVALVSFALILSTVYLVVIYRENRIRQTPKAYDNFEKLSEPEKRLAGDLHPSYVYQY